MLLWNSSWRCSAAWSPPSATICRCRCAPNAGGAGLDRGAFSLILLTSIPSCASQAAVGRHLSPALRDIGLAVHPRCSIGYVGFSISFSFAVAAVRRPSTPPGRAGCGHGRWWRGYSSRSASRWDRGPILNSAGAAGGSGTVENASLMPWLAGTALLHSAVVMEKRSAEGLDHPAVDPDLFAVAARHLPGALGRADLGACVRDRSGARRVHPADPLPVHRRQLFCVRLARIGAKQGGLFAPISREGALVLNNLFSPRPAPPSSSNAVSGAGGLRRRQDFGRGAVLQPDLRSLVHVPLMVACRSRRCCGSAAIWPAQPTATAAGIAARRHRRAVGVDPGGAVRTARDQARGLRHRRRLERLSSGPRAVSCAAGDRDGPRARIAARPGAPVRACRVRTHLIGIV